jgi:preprotein translocase SecE subunit
VSINREQKRQMQRQGYQLDKDGNPVGRAPSSSKSAPGSRRGSNVTPKAADVEPKQNVVKKLIRYLKDVRLEMTKVNWPTKPEVRNLTAVVIITLGLMMGLIFVLDYFFAKAALWIFK